MESVLLVSSLSVSMSVDLYVITYHYNVVYVSPFLLQMCCDKGFLGCLLPLDSTGARTLN